MSIPVVDDVQSLLDTDRFGRSMRGFERVGSTNTEAAAWARDGAPEGAIVATEYQSEGRGRHGRTWDAQKGQNLMFSVVLRPTLPTDRLGLITVAASVAVAEAIDHVVSPHRTTLKWPNDVLLEGRKTCGMLLESSISGQQATEAVVLGVGLNVNQTQFPEELAETATSLHLTIGRRVPRAPLFARLLKQLEEHYDTLEAGQYRTVRSAFHDRLVTLHEETTLHVTGGNQSISGVVQGITETGALRIRTEEGPTVVHAGTVTSQPNS